MGDIIHLDGSSGKVIDIGNASITLQGDSKTIVIPLRKLTSKKVEIFSSDRQLN